MFKSLEIEQEDQYVDEILERKKYTNRQRNQNSLKKFPNFYTIHIHYSAVPFSFVNNHQQSEGAVFKETKKKIKNRFLFFCDFSNLIKI